MPFSKLDAAWLARVAGICGAAFLLLGACGAPAVRPSSGATSTSTPGVALPTNEPPSSPVPSPTKAPNVGFNLAVTADFGAPPTAEQFANWYDLIVTGTVIQILPAQWSTPDGTRPNDLDYAKVPDIYAIITPAVIELDGAPLIDRYGVDVSSGQIVVAAFGGQVGNDLITINDPSQQLSVGQHVLAGLSDRPSIGSDGLAPYQTPAGPAWTLGLAYTITENGQLFPRIPQAEPIDAQTFIQAVIAASRSTPTP